MSHYRMLDREPSAIITVGGSEKKIYKDGQIFINDGENFEIRFFNPLQEKIGVEILFNGQKKNDGLLVLKPGEDIILDRFLGEKKKMRYETYTIDKNNDTAVKAAALNGLVEFRFHKEKSSQVSYFSANITLDCCYTSSSTYVVPGSITTGSSGSTRSIGTKGINYKSYSSPGVFSCEHDKSNTQLSESLSKDIDYSDYVAENKDGIDYSKYVQEKLETGRIEKGPESNQNLTTVDVEFEPSPFYIITYQLKPNSQKPTEIAEIRNYCTKCGYRLRKNSWVFCPKCGLPI